MSCQLKALFYFFLEFQSIIHIIISSRQKFLRAEFFAGKFPWDLISQCLKFKIEEFNSA